MDRRNSDSFNRIVMQSNREGEVIGSLEKPSLGDGDVVRGLVSEFASEIVNTRKSYNEDTLTAEEARERTRQLARNYGDIVMGRDMRYMPQPWHDPSRLGRRIPKVVPVIAGVNDPGELLFLTIGCQLVSLAVRVEKGLVTDEEKAQRKVQEMLLDTANLILGLR